MRPFNKDHSWGNKEVKDWGFERNEQNQLIINPSHPNWWQDKKNPDRCGIRIPILDEDGNQKVGARNRKQCKRVTVDATGWNNPKNCELWRSEWAKECNLHLPKEKQIDHRSFARQGKVRMPTIHEGTDARMIGVKFQRGKSLQPSWKVTKNKTIRQQNVLLEKIQSAFKNIADTLHKWKEILDDIRRKQLSNSHAGKNDFTVRGTTGDDAGVIPATGKPQSEYSELTGTDSAMGRIGREIEQREPDITDTERRINEAKKRLEKVRETIERFSRLTARRTGTSVDESSRRPADGNRGQGQDDSKTENTSERIARLKREAEQREQRRERTSLKERLEASRTAVEDRERERDQSKRANRGHSR